MLVHPKQSAVLELHGNEQPLAGVDLLLPSAPRTEAHALAVGAHPRKLHFVTLLVPSRVHLLNRVCLRQVYVVEVFEAQGTVLLVTDDRQLLLISLPSLLVFYKFFQSQAVAHFG